MTYLGVEMRYKCPDMMEKWLYLIYELYKKYPDFNASAMEFKGEL